jgi:hypothetical protein
VIALSVCYAQRSSTKGTCRSGKSRCGGQRCTRNFEQNLRRWRGRAPHRNQSTPGADVQCSSKLKEFLATFILGTHEDGDGQGQPYPLASFLFGLAAYQGVPWKIAVTPRLWAS